MVKDKNKLVVRTPRQFKEMQDIDVFLHHRVTGIDVEEKTVRIYDLKNAEAKLIKYDKLIISTGARSRKLEIPGSYAGNIFTLKDLQDAIAIKSYIGERKPEIAVIIGGGFIGLEMCEAFRSLGIETHLICRRDLPAGNLEREISELILKEILANGVNFLPEREPISFTVNGDEKAEYVQTTKGNYKADIVLVATGVIPNSEIAIEAGVLTGVKGAIRTDKRQKTNVPDIFAAGDCCDVYNLVAKDWFYTPLGDIANKQGRVAGENAAGGDAVFHGVVGSAAFKVFDLEVAFTGLGTETAARYGFQVDTRLIESESKVGYMPGAQKITIKIIFDRRNGKLLGAQMAGKEGVARRINVFAVALHSGMTVEEISNLDLAYAPPFSPPLDPVLIAAQQAVKK